MIRIPNPKDAINATETAVSTILSAIGEKDENENVTNLLLRRNKQQTDKGRAGYAMADGSIDSLYQSLPSLHCTIAPQPCTIVQRKIIQRSATQNNGREYMKRNERKEKEFHSLQRCYDILSQTQNRYKIKE